jgi:hypothetical protein
MPGVCSERRTKATKIEIDGASMWICRGADVATVTAIVQTLKGCK